jgi:archaellum biogenesis protein FlaJ (TadC family)
MPSGVFLKTYKKAAILLFGGITNSVIESFEPLRPHLKNTNIRILFKTWISIIFMTSFVAYIAAVAAVIAFQMLFNFDTIFFMIYIVFVPVLAASFAFLLFYIYPIEVERSKVNSTENNLPFAINHMSAIASSGIPPEAMFRLLIDVKEYGTIADTSKLIIRNIIIFNMSSVNAIKDAADRTPSKKLRELLIGITSTIETGGSLISYLKEMAERAMFDYRVKREKYISTLSTYADMYTALLVSAPMMMLSTLATMNIIGGDILGFTIPELISLMTWVALPAINIAFLAFIHFTYPSG